MDPNSPHLNLVAYAVRDLDDLKERVCQSSPWVGSRFFLDFWSVGLDLGWEKFP